MSAAVAVSKQNEPHKIREILGDSLVRPAKTGTRISVMEHLSHVLQVALYVTDDLEIPAAERNRVCLAAALHDIGKTITRPSGKRWYHATESAELVADVLADEHFSGALRDAGLDVNLPAEEIEIIAKLVAEHHGMSAATLLRSPSAVLMLIADALASSLEQGWSGPISVQLANSTYHSSALALAEACGWEKWLGTEIRRLELPTDTISDLMLAERVFEVIRPKLAEFGLKVVMRESGVIWLGGDAGAIERLLDTEIAVADILDVASLQGVYERPGAPRVPTYTVESLEYLLLNDSVACSVLRAIFKSAGEEKTRILETHGLTWEVLTASATDAEMRDPELLAQRLYAGIRSYLGSKSKAFGKAMPESVDALVPETGETRGRVTKIQADAFAAFKKDCDSITAADLDVIRKLITTNNSGRSVMNVLLARAALQADLQARRVAFVLRDVCSLDGQPFAEDPPELSRSKQKYKAPCAACARYRASVRATTLVMGATEGDGFWASAGVRKKPSICAWCHMAGIADLPIVSVRKIETRHVREMNYLLVRSVLSRHALIDVLEKIGLLTGKDVDLARAEADDATEEITADDEGLFIDLFGEVPEQTSVMRVGGLLGGLKSRGVNAVMLPGDAPLATKCIFALPSAAFFGFHRTGDMNQEVMDLVSAGVISILKRNLGPASFALRATSNRAAVQLRSSELTDSDMRYAEAAWGLAEMRRRLAYQITGLQNHDALDIGFILHLRRDHRSAAADLLRDLRRLSPDGANRIAGEILALVSVMDEARPDPTTAALQDVVRLLRRGGFVRRFRGLVRRADRGWVGRSEGSMSGALLETWRLSTNADLQDWLNALLQERPKATGEIEAIRGTLHQLTAGDPAAVASVLRRLGSEAVLLALETSN